ncbi:hypothetical protein [Alicyclobacillus vulcanalis]|uniref:Uncharacterized protein n=1 Tax=Alicyclobacillus vulcanalis TaxID=252246 RepID=A0A1N7MTV5_9BACL|nr:hypothetical protein [Alicyclobacillus vulcanalis]SIS89565.1 hypothetical protein SAMN05421799_106118 [Alicyclobacillus vulcanalis]
MVRQKSSVALMSVAFVALCGYMALNHVVSERRLGAGVTHLAGAQQASMPVAAAPSNAELEAMTASLADIPGLYDLAVLPDDRGDGQFVVSAMAEIQTPSGGVPNPTEAFRDMRAETDAFMSDLYLLQEPIAEAEITFTEGGNIVGTAGLGRTVYHELATHTAGEDLAVAMEGEPQDETNVTRACWIEFKPLAE